MGAMAYVDARNAGETPDKALQIARGGAKQLPPPGQPLEGEFIPKGAQAPRAALPPGNGVTVDGARVNNGMTVARPGAPAVAEQTPSGNAGAAANAAGLGIAGALFDKTPVGSQRAVDKINAVVAGTTSNTPVKPTEQVGLVNQVGAQAKEAADGAQNMQQFVQQFRTQHGRDPSAGEVGSFNRGELQGKPSVLARTLNVSDPIVGMYDRGSYGDKQVQAKVARPEQAASQEDMLAQQTGVFGNEGKALTQGVRGIGNDLNGNMMYRYDTQSPEEKARYGRSIYADSAYGASPKGFDEAIRKHGVTPMYPEGQAETGQGTVAKPAESRRYAPNASTPVFGGKAQPGEAVTAVGTPGSMWGDKPQDARMAAVEDFMRSSEYRNMSPGRKASFQASLYKTDQDREQSKDAMQLGREGHAVTREGNQLTANSAVARLVNENAQKEAEFAHQDSLEVMKAGLAGKNQQELARLQGQRADERLTKQESARATREWNKNLSTLMGGFTDQKTAADVWGTIQKSTKSPEQARELMTILASSGATLEGEALKQEALRLAGSLKEDKK